MKKFYRFALAATLATYFLIFVGGLVRVSGAGLGCPDWPKCFGRWFPPTSVSQLPPDIDPARFNFALAWIEYVNRLIGVTVGLLIAITAIWALVAFRSYKRIVIPAVLAALLVAYQGWQGGQMIEARLQSFLVSLHMGLAFVIAALMVYLIQQAYFMIQDKYDSRPGPVPGQIRLWLFGLTIVSIVQVVIGTQVRTALEKAFDIYPLLSGGELLSRVGWFHPVHIVLGVAVTLLSWQLGARVIRRVTIPMPMASLAAWGVIILATLQIILGAAMAIAGAQPILQLFHLLLSALYIGSIVSLFCSLRQQGGSP